MKRSGFANKVPGRPPKAPLVPLKPEVTASLARSDGRARLTVPIPKGPKAKPGKGAPTIEERRWMDAITGFGCVACWLDGCGGMPSAVHHILRGGRRMGHLYTLPLCDPGHHQNGQEAGKVSRHPWKTRFEAKYGTELSLLDLMRNKLGFLPVKGEK